jgi:hypothetical protein
MLDRWAKAVSLELVDSTSTTRRVARIYFPSTPQSFIEIYYSVPDDRKSTAEVFVGVVAPTRETRSRIKTQYGMLEQVAARIRDVAVGCDGD